MQQDSQPSLIPVIYARVISHAAGRTPQQVKAVLQGTGIADESGRNQSRGMTIGQYRRLLQNARAISGDSAIALRAGMNLPLTTHGDVGIASSTAPSYRVALDVFSAYIKVRNPYGGTRVVRRGDQVELVAEMDSVLGAERDMALDLVFAIFCSGPILDSLPVLANPLLNISRPEPHNSDLYRELLRCDIRWDQNTDGFVFPAADLDQPLPGSNPEEFQKALSRLRRFHLQTSPTENFSEAVTRIFVQQAGRICTIAAVTAELHCSPRTLNRKLRQEGTSFQTLLDQWLSQQALKYLRDGQLSIEATAALLGYGDEANLRRAFKRWFGVAPTRFINA